MQDRLESLSYAGAKLELDRLESLSYEPFAARKLPFGARIKRFRRKR